MLLRRCLLFLCAALSLLAPAAYGQSEPRLALLIGNAAYKSAPLINPVNDVRLMESVLKEVGFTVIKSENASIREMRRLVRDFGDRLKASGGVGLFYFAGHGVQVRGENFLVSTDSDIRNEDEVADDAVNASVILEKMQGAGNRMNLIILDACRNNPFAVKSRTASAGLATMSAPSGSLVAYATAPGSVAFDGSGNNGLYTKHLAEVIRQPGLPVEEMFKQVRASVRKESNNQQTPWENTALEGQFFFKAPVQLASAATNSAVTAARPTGPDMLAVDLAFWESVKGSQRNSELQAYLTQFPNGIFAVLARGRLEETKVAASSSPPSAAAPAPRPVAAGVIGTLVLMDGLSGVKRSQDLTVQSSDAQQTVYSSGDVIARDGRVLQVMVGEAVLRLAAGALWTVPLQAGTSGEAKIERTDMDYKSPGTLKWKAVAANDGKVRIEADVQYLFKGVSSGTFSPSGKWLAVYSGGNALPESSSSVIRDSHSSQAPGARYYVSAELKLR